MRAITEQQKQEAIAAFAYEGTLIADTVYGSGHINDTFRLTFAVGNMGDLDVILQRMNADAFPHPEQLMENIAGVTGFLKKKIIARGGDPERETLNIIPTVDNKPYYRDTNGDYWRSYRFITGASSFDQVETPQQFYESAVAFGSFQRLLADYPAETLHETIPGFHDTRARFAAFEKAVREDVVGRAAEVQKEIAFFLERKETACYFAGRLDRGERPPLYVKMTRNAKGGICCEFQEKRDVTYCKTKSGRMDISSTGIDSDCDHEFLSDGAGIYHFPAKGNGCQYALYWIFQLSENPC